MDWSKSDMKGTDSRRGLRVNMAEGCLSESLCSGRIDRNVIALRDIFSIPRTVLRCNEINRLYRYYNPINVTADSLS